MSESVVNAGDVEESVTNIKIKSRNRMNTDTLDDRMMVCSNGPPVSAQHTTAINEIVDLAFEHWSQARTRIPSRSIQVC